MSFATLIPILLSLLGRGMSPDIEQLIRQLLDQLIPRHDEPVPVAIDVRKTQEKLKALGFNPGPIDGLYGQRTKAAVLAYEQARNISPADGLIDQATFDRLMSEA
jgi:peptidoglycan hydrolase-like protein with peptidoglycan-binding domain